MNRVAVTRLALAITISGSATASCRAHETILDAIFTCDPEAGDAQCGTDENGKPMTCYVGSAQLGGKAFCTKTCDPASHDDRDTFCTGSGALLEICHPTRDDVRCRSPLNCYRTDALYDAGLCLDVPICPYAPDGVTLDAGQCGTSRPMCAGELVQELALQAGIGSAIGANNLHCVAEPPCTMYGCPNTGLPEACPSEFYSAGFGLPVTCGAPCDRFSCPPNFACAGSAGPGDPPICLPGLLGMRCQSDEDCFTGNCLDTGAGFSVCSFAGGCTTDSGCNALRLNPAHVCAEGPDGGICVSPVPYSGTNCYEQSDCVEPLICGSEPCPPRRCSWYSVYEIAPDHGICRYACDPNEGCRALGGMPYVCLESGCHPGTFGIPCSTDADCFANLTCEAVPPDERTLVDAPRICTAPCRTDNGDADCSFETNPWLGHGGYCAPADDPLSSAEGYCRVAGQADQPCERGPHCLSGVCEPNGSGALTCR